MVHQEGFEPPTLCSEDRCSIQLSYWCRRRIVAAYLTQTLEVGLRREQKEFVTLSGLFCYAFQCRAVFIMKHIDDLRQRVYILPTAAKDLPEHPSRNPQPVSPYHLR